MEDKYQKVVTLLEQAESLDKESVLGLWVGLTNMIAVMYPNEFFHVMRNSILQPFESQQIDVNFAKIAGGVFYSLQHVFMSDPKYMQFYKTISSGDDN